MNPELIEKLIDLRGEAYRVTYEKNGERDWIPIWAEDEDELEEILSREDGGLSDEVEVLSVGVIS